jgi:hypothetical protein
MLEIGGVMFRVVVILCTLTLLSGCSASDKFFDAIHDPIHAVVDKLPAWAGGRPDALPPAPTDPAYAAYKAKLEGKSVSTPTAEESKLSPLH